MHVVYDRPALLLAIDLDAVCAVDAADSVDLTPRVTVVVDDAGEPLTIEIAGADTGIEEPIAAVLGRWPHLDREAIVAAAQSGLAAPNRDITLTVAAA